MNWKSLWGVLALICALNALAEPVKIGNPGMSQFPNNSLDDCIARSVWDMHYYDGGIYIGYGDLRANRGPIDVWSLDAGGSFTKEYTVDEEQVSIFRTYDGKLFIPGTDAMEPWDYGNLYVKDGGVWQKLRTIPRPWNGPVTITKRQTRI